METRHICGSNCNAVWQGNLHSVTTNHHSFIGRAAWGREVVFFLDYSPDSGRTDIRYQNGPGVISYYPQRRPLKSVHNKEKLFRKEGREIEWKLRGRSKNKPPQQLKGTEVEDFVRVAKLIWQFFTFFPSHCTSFLLFWKSHEGDEKKKNNKGGGKKGTATEEGRRRARGFASLCLPFHIPIMRAHTPLPHLGALPILWPQSFLTMLMI